MKNGRWNSERAETLAELLIAVLVVTLGLTMFASALMTSERMMAKNKTSVQAYYEQRNELNREKTGQPAVLILEKAGVRKNLGADSSQRETGCYPIQIFSDQERSGTLYRYRSAEQVE